jgi:hypothetical protein
MYENLNEKVYYKYTDYLQHKYEKKPYNQTYDLYNFLPLIYCLNFLTENLIYKNLKKSPKKDNIKFNKNVKRFLFFLLSQIYNYKSIKQTFNYQSTFLRPRALEILSNYKLKFLQKNLKMYSKIFLNLTIFKFYIYFFFNINFKKNHDSVQKLFFYHFYTLHKANKLYVLQQYRSPQVLSILYNILYIQINNLQIYKYKTHMKKKNKIQQYFLISYINIKVHEINLKKNLLILKTKEQLRNKIYIQYYGIPPKFAEDVQYIQSLYYTFSKLCYKRTYSRINFTLKMHMRYLMHNYRFPKKLIVYFMKHGHLSVAERRILFVAQILKLVLKLPYKSIHIFFYFINILAIKVEYRTLRLGRIDYISPHRVHNPIRQLYLGIKLLKTCVFELRTQIFKMENRIAFELLQFLTQRGLTFKAHCKYLDIAYANRRYAHYRWI